MEAYAVDYNSKYPYDWTAVISLKLTDVLSTPVGYVSTGSAFDDPFRVALGGDPHARRYRYVNYPANKIPMWVLAHFQVRM